MDYMFNINLNNLCGKTKPEETVNKYETRVPKSAKNSLFKAKTNQSLLLKSKNIGYFTGCNDSIDYSCTAGTRIGDFRTATVGSMTTRAAATAVTSSSLFQTVP
jgi:hypothetical protein